MLYIMPELLPDNGRSPSQKTYDAMIEAGYKLVEPAKIPDTLWTADIAILKASNPAGLFTLEVKE